MFNKKKNKKFEEKEPFFRKILNFIVLKPLFKWVFKVEIKGIENIPEMGVPAIVAGNHVGSFDAASLIEKIPRHVFYMGKKELEKNPFGRFAIRNYGIITVDRMHVGTGTFKELEDKIQEGRLIGIYPEGTKRGILKGKKLKNGAVSFSINQNVPIIPVAFKPDFKPFRKNYIHIGRPINFSKLVKENENEINKKVLEKYTNYLMDNIIKLLEKEDQKKYYEAIAKRNNILENNLN